MTSNRHRPQLLKLALSVVIDVPGHMLMPPIDLLIEVHAEATVQDLIDAIVRYNELADNPNYGLIRTMVRTRDLPPHKGIRYLPDSLPLADCGLLDGVTLHLADRSLRPAPMLYIDREQADDDLFLIDERGTHRGRITRLPVDIPVLVGMDPPDDGDRSVLVDDSLVAAHALTLINRDGSYVQCTALHKDGLYLSGTPATESQTRLLPGNSISFRRDGTDYVSFVVTTKAALHGRSPVGRVQFDVTARLEDPTYEPLPERIARIRVQPKVPEHRPFPWEQVLIPLGIVVALYLATRSTLSLIASPLAAVFPVVSFFRQRNQGRNRYRKERAAWVESLQKTSNELTRLTGLEERNLRLENPAPETWALRAYRRLAGLWERDPERTDFLHVRVGLGQLLSRYESRLEEGFDRDDTDFISIMEIRGRKIGEDVVRPQLFDVPVTVDLRKYHLGLVGALHVVDDVATDVLVQISCAHPPGAVGIAALLPASRRAREPYDWLKWLPHTRSGSTLLPSARIVAGREACDVFLTEMQRLHQERREHRADEKPDSFAVVVVHEAAEIDIALLTEVCALADGLVRVLWLGSSKDSTPKLVTSMVEVREDRADATDSTGLLRSGEESRARQEFALDLFRVKPLDTVHALAGLYDPRSSGANAGVPQSAPLSAVTQLDGISYADSPDMSLADSFPIPMGIGEVGALDLDLIKQGPHVLIGGTTGSGKSELLQTLTCGVISRYSPAEVSLFLVDFKGGATFAPFRGLPHVVGYVTDLDQRNVNRALDFLRAELRRREQCFEDMDNAKEYRDYLERALAAGRDDILPRLVVIFDEFATIVQDFERETIDAVIDIARRGRSWAVHLILATQQPTRDVVVPQVRGNVNARIALRTPSPDESQTIIDRPEAAHIPHAIQGRALMTLGGNRLIEFQTAYSGAPFVPDDNQSRVYLTAFDIISAAGPQGTSVQDATSGPSPSRDPNEQGRSNQLQALVGNVRTLGRPTSLGVRQMPPALEEEPERHAPAWLHTLQAGSPTTLWLGMRDLPHRQRQDRLETDLSRGGLCILGPNRSGITTALVTVAEAFASRMLPATRATVISFDAADQLNTELNRHFENVVPLSMTRLDDITRCIDQLWLRIQARMARASGPGEDRGAAVDRSVLLLIDGFDVLMRALVSSKLSFWAARLTEVLTLGRRSGIYSCIAARRLRDLDSSIITSQATIITLHGHHERLNTPQEDRLPGFGLDPDGNLVQMFMPRDAGHGRAKASFDGDLAAAFAPERWRQLGLAPLGSRGEDLTVRLGVEELYHRTFPVSLGESHVLVIGGVRSGRTKLLLTLADQLAAQAGTPVAYFSPRGLPNGVHSPNIAVMTRDELLELHKLAPRDRAAYLAGLGVAQLKDGRAALLADDCYAIESMEDGSQVNTVLSTLHKQSLIQVIAATTANWVGNSLLTQSLKSSGVTVYLKPTADPSEFDNGYRVRGVALRHRPGMIYKKGDVIIQTDETQFVAHAPSLAEAGSA